MNPHEKSKRMERVVNSMLWSAWGDVIGFPAELVSEKQYQRRLSGTGRGGAVQWSKTIGGRFGVEVSLPQGAYSDDTQLRIATARSIRSTGAFDVEVFSKIELTIWLSYALGAGRGSKAAATSLASSNVAWFSNFFDNKYSKYLAGGGNGAAMRIQPHIWASSNLAEPMSYIKDVVRNSVCTHGHCRAILGAVIHAEHLAYSMMYGRVPSSDTWLADGEKGARLLLAAIDSEAELKDFWKPTWEKLSRKKFDAALKETVEEWRSLVATALGIESGPDSGADAYRRLVADTGGLDAATRGSGLLAAMLSVAGSSWLEGEGSEGALTVMGTLIGSDTDTIASMAGALIGCCSSISPPARVQDEAYLCQVAERLNDVSAGQEVDDFIYPDLLYWQPPRTALDAVSISERGAAIAGLGRLDPVGEQFLLPREGGAYRWFSTWFGQSMLCKYRTSQFTDSLGVRKAVESVPNEIPERFDLFDRQVANNPDPGMQSIKDLSDEVIRGGFDPLTIGKSIVALASSGRPIEDSVAFVAIVTKAMSIRN